MLLSLQQEKVNAILEPVVSGMGFDFVGTEQVNRDGAKVLCVYVNKTGGVNLDECADISHQIGGVLDVEDIMAARYRLEVSSPGLEQPLFTPEQFQDCLGKKLSVKLSVMRDKQRRFTGFLTSATSEEIVLQLDDEAKTLAYADMAKAHIVYEFEQKTRQKS